MYRRDLILKETEKLAKALAGLLGFKSRQQQPEANQAYENALKEFFGLSASELTQVSADEFAAWLAAQNYNADKLTAFAQLIYHQQHPFKNNPETLALLQKALIIFDRLEKQHHVQSFENMGMIHQIHQYIQQHHA